MYEVVYVFLDSARSWIIPYRIAVDINQQGLINDSRTCRGANGTKPEPEVTTLHGVDKARMQHTFNTFIFTVASLHDVD